MTSDTLPFDIWRSRWAWAQAALCYEAAGQSAEAARCHVSAGQEARAAPLFLRAGLPRAAAQAWLSAGESDVAAWILVHDLDDVAAARACLPPQPDTDGSAAGGQDDARLSQRLVEARCAIADGTPADSVLPLLQYVQVRLAQPGDPRPPVHIEQWAVAVAVMLGRFDQVALVYAGAVRGGDTSAATRWQRWAQHRFGQPIVLPPPGLPPAEHRSAS